MKNSIFFIRELHWKTIVCICLAFLICCSLASCSVQPIVPNEDLSYVEEDQTVYSSNGLDIHYRGAKGLKSIFYDVINNTSEDIFCSVSSVAINHCMVWDMSPITQITAGNQLSANYCIIGCKDYGIDSIDTIDIYFHLSNSSGETIDDPLIHIDISESSDFSYQYQADLFYEDEYIAAYSELTGNTFKDFNVIYQNKTDSILFADLTASAINGEMLSTNIMGYWYILPGCFAYTGASTDSISIWSALEQEIQEKGLEPMRTMTAKLSIFGDDIPAFTSDTLVIFGE